MEINNNNLDEQFLLTLLDISDGVYYSDIKNEEHLYFYPKNFGGTVKIPCLKSEALEINFEFERENKYKDIVSVSFPSIHSCPSFINKIFEEHQRMLNYSSNFEKGDKIVSDFLLQPINIINVSLPGENMFILNKTATEKTQVNIGRPLFDFDKPKKLYPLMPVVFDCFIDKNNDLNEQRACFKKVIPTYKLGEFPILKKYAYPYLVANSLSQLSEELKKINPKAAIVCHNFILDQTLSKKNDFKLNKSKI